MKPRSLHLLLTLTVFAAMLVTGCDSRSALTTVSDSSGLFHVRVPEDWQSNPSQGVMALYAADKLPETEDQAFENLSVAIYTSDAAGTQPVADELVELVQARAADRAWRDSELGQPTEMTVGKRQAWSMDVSGTDSGGRAFSGRATLIRTNGREVLAFSVAPKAEWADQVDAVDGLFAEWYWHSPEDSESIAESATPSE